MPKRVNHSTLANEITQPILTQHVNFVVAIYPLNHLPLYHPASPPKSKQPE